jgi:hypothetical protein
MLHHLVGADDLHLAAPPRLGKSYIGAFTPIEVILTLVVGAASIAGLLTGFRWRTSLGWIKALSTAALFAVPQLAALRISFLPSIAKDR